MTCITKEQTGQGVIVRRYENERLVAERGSDYSLGAAKITDSEYRNALYGDPIPTQEYFLRSLSGKGVK